MKGYIRKFLEAFLLMIAMAVPGHSLNGADVTEVLLGDGEGPVIRVLDCDFRAPYLSRDNQGTLQGFYVDLLKALAAKGNFRFQLLAGGERSQLSETEVSPCVFIGPPTPLSMPTQLRAFRAYGVEGFSFKEMGNLDEAVFSDRKDNIFAIPFLSQSASLFTRSDSTFAGERDRRVFVVKGSPEEELLRRSSLSWELIPCGSVSEAFQGLASGRGDAAAVETSEGKCYLSQSGAAFDHLKLLSFPLRSYARSMIIVNCAADVPLKLSQALQQLWQSGEYKQLLRRWLEPYNKALGFNAPFIKRAFCVILALTAAAFLWNSSLKYKVKHIICERERILDFVADGILAVDQKGTLTMLNGTARKFLGLDARALGQNADALIPDLNVQEIIDSGESVCRMEQNLRGALVSCNKVPVLLDGKACGAIVTLRDMSELQSMAEEISGVKMYVESLRIHTHEFMNKLQALAGMIHLKQYARAEKFIAAECDISQSYQNFVTERVKNAAVCGILMGKMGLCREQGIRFVLMDDSFCGDHSAEISDRALVVVIGNLLQNAVEAHLEAGVTPRSRITFTIYDEGGELSFSVRDNAGLLTDDSAPLIFTKGFSTKKRKAPSGFGLFTIRSIVTSLGGDIVLDYKTGRYTDFTVTLPLGKGTNEKTCQLPSACL